MKKQLGFAFLAACALSSAGCRRHDNGRPLTNPPPDSVLAAQAKTPASPSDIGTITVIPSLLTMKVGETAQVNPAAKSVANAAMKVVFTYNSENPAVATVSSTGLVTAVGPGKTSITILSADKYCTVPVTAEK